MKTASVADLRNNFATISRWIYEGESVAIQKRGKAFAILSPSPRRQKKPVALPDYEARLRRVFGSKIPGGTNATELIDDMRGNY